MLSGLLGPVLLFTLLNVFGNLNGRQKEGAEQGQTHRLWKQMCGYKGEGLGEKGWTGGLGLAKDTFGNGMDDQEGPAVWQRHMLAAAAPIWPWAWECLYAPGVVPKSKKQNKTKSYLKITLIIVSIPHVNFVLMENICFPKENILVGRVTSFYIFSKSP